MAIDPKVQLPAGAVTFNEQFFDAMVRHQIGLMRLSGSLRNDVLKILDATEQDLSDKIRSRLRSHRGLDTPRSVTRLQSLLKAIRVTRLKAWSDVNKVWVRELIELSKAEPAFTSAALETVVPTVLNTVLPAPEFLARIAVTRPFQGKILRGWASEIARADIARIETQIRIGMVQGESSAQIARRVVGTAKLRGRDGVTEISRRQAAGITRTAVNAISNQARREFNKANQALFARELYVATLDSRTTPICQSLDGERFPVGEGPYPPVHFNCRSLRIAILDGRVLGTRPMREFTEPQMVREFSKNAGLPRTFNRRADLPRGTKGSFDKFKAKRIRELTGRVPAKVNYEQWLRRQSVQFQDDILGPARGKLFRKGGLTLDKFVDRNTGRRFTLEELKAAT